LEEHVAGKYTFCRLRQLENKFEASTAVVLPNVGKLVNLTHSKDMFDMNIPLRLVQALIDGTTKFFKLLQLPNTLDKEVHEFKVGGSVTEVNL
jgi:hypothetical protein